MEAKDVWLLLAGTLLGFLASLLATFTAPSIGNAFGKLKSGFIERNKARALAAYTVVHDLKFGKRDKYLYAIIGWGSLNALTLMSIATGGMGFAARRVLGPAVSSASSDPLGLRVLALAVALTGISIVLMIGLHLYLTFARLENFENYRSQLLKRWPDLELPDLQAAKPVADGAADQSRQQD
ncbi:hypothetical protein MTX26_01360 [Bradyrhizobium sp. ISRA443]|uniref:hypothetical protein n=1 Tax=unclassified Bradyrhizobium TaxID=2631580 RepID=UPI0024791EB0|nr:MULTISPECIES: hypothetical protein [unclassified Bradyrhizobium]WGR94729.1 hypothetical protein MTX20_11380 [Bradyrhizobium sp. ISRA435]WGR99550.1 hypothetical protein MTX23_01360 [Bradyrhizobium sp. ISRA436]WGS06440.1 hypothetical protein MTX18_01360 [Bradyrhizobium sp. ISRA437]WGS13324.1 hypothetical protein MTX26_01360 [Bradyrhizobium sp. ISRA443]